tara:strand:- start:9 stop:812 length:804 start_codon:yes stop_codon:yes gene_type:complete
MTTEESRSTLDRDQEIDLDAGYTSEGWRTGWKIKAEKLAELAEDNLLEMAEKRLVHLGSKLKRDRDRASRNFGHVLPGRQEGNSDIRDFLQSTLTGDVEGIARLGWRLEMLSLGRGILALAWEPLVDASRFEEHLNFDEIIQQATDQILSDRHIFYYQYHRAVFYGLQDSFISSTALDMTENGGSLGEWPTDSRFLELGNRNAISPEYVQTWREGTSNLAFALAEEQARQELAWAWGPRAFSGGDDDSSWSILCAAYEKHNTDRDLA